MRRQQDNCLPQTQQLPQDPRFFQPQQPPRYYGQYGQPVPFHHEYHNPNNPTNS